jgi:hypothetical protein
MTEREQAIGIANKWLEHPPDMMGDPDCDHCIVARQLIRAIEEIDALKQEFIIYEH